MRTTKHKGLSPLYTREDNNANGRENVGSKVAGKYLIKIGKLIQLSINIKEVSYTLVHINLEKLHHINRGSSY